MEWRKKIEAEMAEYEEEYSRYTPARREEKLAEQRAWLESMACVERILELLIEVWDSRDTELGWAVYHHLKKRDGNVPNPDELTADHVRDGLLPEYDYPAWRPWVEREYAAHSAKQQEGGMKGPPV